MRREPASGFLRVFLTVAELTEAIRWKEFLLSLYIVSGKLETLYIEQKRPSGRAFRKKDKKRGKKRVDKRGRIWYSNGAVSAERSSGGGGGRSNEKNFCETRKKGLTKVENGCIMQNVLSQMEAAKTSGRERTARQKTFEKPEKRA